MFQKERKNVLLILGIMEEKEERYPYHQDETCNWFNYFSKREGGRAKTFSLIIIIIIIRTGRVVDIIISRDGIDVYTRL